MLGGGDPAERAETLSLAEEVRAAMAKLKPQERRVAGLLALGYSHQEIVMTGWTFTRAWSSSARE